MKLIDDKFERFEEDFEANPNAIFIIPVAPNYKPIKIILSGGLEMTDGEDQYDIITKMKLSKTEIEKLLNNMFETPIDLGILSCENIEGKLNE